MAEDLDRVCPGIASLGFGAGNPKDGTGLGIEVPAADDEPEADGGLEVVPIGRPRVVIGGRLGSAEEDEVAVMIALPGVAYACPARARPNCPESGLLFTGAMEAAPPVGTSFAGCLTEFDRPRAPRDRTRVLSPGSWPTAALLVPTAAGRWLIMPPLTGSRLGDTFCGSLRAGRSSWASCSSPRGFRNDRERPSMALLFADIPTALRCGWGCTLQIPRLRSLLDHLGISDSGRGGRGAKESSGSVFSCCCCCCCCWLVAGIVDIVWIRCVLYVGFSRVGQRPIRLSTRMGRSPRGQTLSSLERSCCF